MSLKESGGITKNEYVNWLITFLKLVEENVLTDNKGKVIENGENVEFSKYIMKHKNEILGLIIGEPSNKWGTVLIGVFDDALSEYQKQVDDNIKTASAYCQKRIMKRRTKEISLCCTTFKKSSEIIRVKFKRFGKSEGESKIFPAYTTVNALLTAVKLYKPSVPVKFHHRVTCYVYYDGAWIMQYVRLGVREF